MLDTTADGGVIIDVHMQPGGSRDEVVGRHGDALKVKVSAPPEGGRANVAVCRLLADAFDVSSSSVEVVSGGEGAPQTRPARRRRSRYRGSALGAAAGLIPEISPSGENRRLLRSRRGRRGHSK